MEIRLNHQPSRPEHRALATIRPRQTTRVEFYLLDGVARVYVGDQREPLLDVEVWPDKRPNHRSLPGASGARFTARGVVTVDNVELDRDVFYYSGWETDYGEKFPLVGSRGEVRINNESFLPMGDHCPSSYDARSWGPVPLDNLLGPAVLVWWPPERLRLIPIPPR
ncbi:MAG: S26 family signal peptidase [Planctomycetota bacterium]|nr:S26 family signal peptidase [Planctomycetota bacterium]